MAWKNRWRGRRQTSTDGYRWRKERCEFCGLRYHREFKLADILGVKDTFAYYKEIISLEAAAREAANDYSQPASRGRVLGRMFEDKQKFWEDHLEMCAQGAVHRAAALGLLSSSSDVEDLYDLLEYDEDIWELLNRMEGESSVKSYS